MSNDPKDAVVDVSKLMQSQSQTPLQPSISTSSDSSRHTPLITVCNESSTDYSETKHGKRD